MSKTQWILVFAGAALLTGCGKRQTTVKAASEPPAVAVAAIRVEPENFETTLPVTGTLVSNARVEVKAEIGGRIARFEKQEGAHVAAGEPVVWVNDENYVLALRQAETAVRVAEAGVDRSELLAVHSRSEMERATNLLKSGGITDKDLKAAQLADRDSGAQVAMANAQLEQARAALSVARKRVGDTVVRSPIAGEIQSKPVNQGAYVEPSTTVFTIVDNSRLELEAYVAAADLAPVRRGQRVAFGVNSYPGEKFEGSVIEVSPAMEEQTRSAKIRVQVVNASGRLKTGMFAQGEILTGLSRGAVVIPAEAAYRDDRSAKSSYVFVIENSRAARRNVRIGHERDARMEIVEGLKQGDQVIAEQNLEIAEGVRVEGRR